MSDKPNVAFTLASLEKEVNKDAQAQEPLKIGLSGSKVITFKNPADLSFFTLATLGDADNEADIVGLFQELLSEEDFEAFKAEKPSGRVVGVLFQRVSEYYQEATVEAQKS